MADGKSPIVAIAGVCGGIMIPIIVMVLVLAREQAWVLTPIVIAIAVMGIFLGYFASKKG